MSNSLPQLAPGNLVRARTRHWLVQDVIPTVGGTTVRLACADEDAQGDELEVAWEAELDARVLDGEAWKQIGSRGFDPPRHFAAFLNTARWSCVTATDSRLFQSPFRAGIQLDPYQLEPLYKALRLPRVNLFVADDVGLGKTIEAALIASELLLRRRVQEILVACPPSMLMQWRDELENRFGLTFEIFDREYVERVRRERGQGVNPWTTFPRFLISHRLLIDESYAGPLDDWLGNHRPGTLLILDEAHHAAPASGSKYAIDSQITKAVRNLAGKFEHRLFLSATPHNGHSNSFSSLLSILDRERFVPGIPVRAANLDAVMVRRLKEDLRSIGVPGFPERKVEAIDLPQPGQPPLPASTPELLLAELLEEYRTLRLDRLQGQPRRICQQFELLVTQLQQRLLSSVEAFACTLSVHRRTMQRVWNRELEWSGPTARTTPSSAAPGPDDELGSATEGEQTAFFDLQTEKATLASGAGLEIEAERALLERMANVADSARGQPDARIRHLVGWLRENLCAGARLPGEGSPQSGSSWTDLRIIIFTEWDDTRRYLEQQLKSAIVGTDRWSERVEVFHGPTPTEKKEALKHAFNAPPGEHPVRILICTDSAREGLNLQAHCWNLFHFDVPWNPARLEQRNGRIDRKLQPESIVYCRYFVYRDRPADKVLRVLARKTETIREELGSFNDVLERRLRHGIRPSEVDQLAKEIDSLELPSAHAATSGELEQTRKRHEHLRDEIAARSRQLETSRKAVGFDPAALLDALSCSLELSHGRGLEYLGKNRYALPNPDRLLHTEGTWSSTLDTLRAPPRNGKRDFEWRRQAPLRPLVFEPPAGLDDSVAHVHLSHRLVSRLLSRFRAQGFREHDLSRACLVQSADRLTRVVLLGRLAVFGPRAARLHEEILTVTAAWTPPSQRNGLLTPYAREAEAKTLAILEEALGPGAGRTLPAGRSAELQKSITQDVTELLAHLEPRGLAALEDARRKLTERGEAEASELVRVLEDQVKRVQRELDVAGKDDWLQLPLPLDEEMRRQDEAERKQRRADMKYWASWLGRAQEDLEREPRRIREFYKIQSHRIEPLGLVYLFPG